MLHSVMLSLYVLICQTENYIVLGLSGLWDSWSNVQVMLIFHRKNQAHFKELSVLFLKFMVTMLQVCLVPPVAMVLCAHVWWKCIYFQVTKDLRDPCGPKEWLMVMFCFVSNACIVSMPSWALLGPCRLLILWLCS